MYSGKAAENNKETRSENTFASRFFIILEFQSVKNFVNLNLT